ncbi:MAG: hypothetical protein UW46_C0001G0034 [Candidatus Yanofskybacteria bacterium GW2011_GWF1_44_227]|uniref:Uncharacterized protein n=1 Tax=Candidatus Yanofskybacteria bacterium GW2011_GWE2_40_11 TaxID=1619033 RepID=A0A0G0TSJ0_9BACT|nr:MAG: hypothetical protein UT75_C0004G0038 [Candidatus Yanofskybacteria bacterium GW2011_GWE2_40_11]KKT15942.1 MAG: hypothetical protein UV97_C0001G0115 [Candidatus Yanofskybacteria bacterium GW2011_GWF2_43_596]KKT53544.1 MAG: hypothetical protein UW46_C0001G0034 [Candidatus Yanofskybacteria bacterium GW2011_GWF1_44_227]OGN36069.1 MAG: hypothetical protein A2207_03360 [Candidatus Yanofskybacteria bacterium RIFOXYA1_FULL_44_17]OGN36329.1 MAG: hypothetical protein A2241_01125 [Candidatus Yanofs
MKVKAIIPFAEFATIYAALPRSENCATVRCAFSKTTCHVREAREACREWWKRTNDGAPGFSNYEATFQNAIDAENAIYWCFRTGDMEPAQKAYDLLTDELRARFSGQLRMSGS